MLRQVVVALVSISVLLLAGCASTPSRLGFSEKQWKAMSEVRRQEVISGHDQIKQRPPSMKRKYNGSDILVYLAQGTAMMPPFVKAYQYQTVKFTLNVGKCRSIRLNSIDTNHHTNLKVCYNGMTLLMDPSRYDPTKSSGTLRFDYNPIWKRGFTYSNVVSAGYVRLKDASVTIKAIPPKKSTIPSGKQQLCTTCQW